MASLIKIGEQEFRVTGGLVRIARSEGDKYESLQDVEGVLKGLRAATARVDLLTFMQIMPDVTPKYSYPMEWDNLAILPVSTFDHWWNQQIRSFPRNRARQAEKRGVVIREVPFDDALIQGIWGVYNECSVRQGKRNVHYGKDISVVRQEEATFLDRSIFIGAFLGDEMIGFVKLVTDADRTQAGLMNILSMVRHRDKAPTNALIAQSVKSCADRGIRHLSYQSFSYGKKQGDSLANFKEVNGFQKVDLPRYFVPLTPLGRLALRTGIHHGLSALVPERMLAGARRLRNSWYSRRQTANEAAS